MASIVRELQTDALNNKIEISDLLRKAYTVARKLKVHEFEEWSNNELNGYSEDATIPYYRILRGAVKANNPYIGQYIPCILPKEMDEALTQKILIIPISQVEYFFLNADKSYPYFASRYPAEVTKMLMKNGPGLIPELHIEVSQLKKIMDTVRNIILQWSLKLEEDKILGSDVAFSEDEIKLANDKNEDYKTIININGMTNSQLQCNTNNSTQKYENNIDLEKVKEIISLIETHIKDIKFDENTIKDIKTDLDTIKLQINNKPKLSIITESLKSLRNIMEGCIGSLIASGISNNITKIIGL